MDDARDAKILRKALGFDGHEAVTPKEARDRLLKLIDKPVKMPDGRVLVLRRRPAEKAVNDAFRVEEITSH